MTRQWSNDGPVNGPQYYLIKRAIDINVMRRSCALECLNFGIGTFEKPLHNSFPSYDHIQNSSECHCPAGPRAGCGVVKTNKTIGIHLWCGAFDRVQNNRWGRAEPLHSRDKTNTFSAQNLNIQSQLLWKCDPNLIPVQECNGSLVVGSIVEHSWLNRKQLLWRMVDSPRYF